jgi:hypothetical protein
MAIKDRAVAQEAAKKSWLNRDLPNWRDQVADLLKGKQIIVNGVREWNGIYVAARRKGVQALRFMIGANKFAVVAEGKFGGKFKFIEAGNIYYAREDELGPLCRLAEKAGISLDCRLIHKTAQSKVFRVVLQR